MPEVAKCGLTVKACLQVVFESRTSTLQKQRLDFGSKSLKSLFSVGVVHSLNNTDGPT